MHQGNTNSIPILWRNQKQLLDVNRNRLQTKYKLSNICNKEYCFQNSFKHIEKNDILGIPLTQIYLSNVEQNDSQIGNKKLEGEKLQEVMLFLLIYDNP